MRQIDKIKGPDDFIRAYNVSRETIFQLETYVELLRKWQKVVNLVASSTIDDIWHRHIGDSAQIVDIVNKSDSPNNNHIWLDIGSGGGFPGLVAAIMQAEHKDMRFHLVESNGRKCAFLSEVTRQLGLPVVIHKARIETLAQEARLGTIDVISARALAPLYQLFELVDVFTQPQQKICFFKGREVEKELQQAQKNWDFTFEKWPSRTSTEGCLLKISELKKKKTIDR